MRKVTTAVTYRVPSWAYCNHQDIISPGRPTQDFCRFCVKTKKGHVCVLHNAMLAVSEEYMVHKTSACLREHRRVVVEDEQHLAKNAVKTILMQYRKVFADLKKQGFDDNTANKLTIDYMLGDKP